MDFITGVPLSMERGIGSNRHQSNDSGGSGRAVLLTLRYLAAAVHFDGFEPILQCCAAAIKKMSFPTQLLP
jgi:hypothetical protein